VKPGAEADRVYLQHMLECIGRVEEYIGGDEQRFGPPVSYKTL